jgi:hypothetical protein
MSLVDLIIDKKFNEAKRDIIASLEEKILRRLEEAKRYVAAEFTGEVTEARNPNIVRMGRVQRIRRRVRRNKKGKIIVQKNVKRSAIKGYRISGNTIKRIPASVRLHKARMLKRSWKTTRKAKLRRSLLKRKMSMRRRSSMGLK